MSDSGGIGEVFGHAAEVLGRALDGLTYDELKQQPAGPDSNPIGWLAWHLTRVQDTSVSSLMRKEQAWVAEGWHAEFGSEPTNIRFSQVTPEEVRTFDPVSVETLVGYWDVVWGHTKTYLATLTPEDLTKLAPPRPNRPDSTVEETLARTCSDNVQHVGQIAYLRGMIRGQGWYGR